MIGSRRLLLIGVIVGSVLLLGVLATLLSGAGRSSERKACDQFIEHLVKREYAKSYELFSDSARESTTSEKWQQTAAGLAPGYEKAEATYLSMDPADSAEDAPEDSSRSELLYTVRNPSTTTNVSCTTYTDSERTAVDGFISKVQE